jgi:L-2,4-diaminobutyrate decarboxylase
VKTYHLTGADVIRQLWQPDGVRKLARELADIASDALLKEDGPVRRPGSPRLAARIVRRGAKKSDRVGLVRDIQKASLHLSHPRFAAQQVAAPIPAAALVESVVAAMNQSLAGWEMSPIATAIDRDLMARFKRLFGYPQRADGSLVPGGALANLTALLAARDALAPGATRTGKAKIALIAGAQSHYSVARSAGILGLASDAVFAIPLNAEFCADVEQTEDAFVAARKAGFRKFILMGSAGSTPTGSFDASQPWVRLRTDIAHGSTWTPPMVVDSRSAPAFGHD